jgi:hypothetical protein
MESSVLAGLGRDRSEVDRRRRRVPPLYEAAEHDDREGVAIATWMTKFRITLNAQYDARSAHAASRPQPRPWETD